jgi:probable HAF family extracellular repeat protein
LRILLAILFFAAASVSSALETRYRIVDVGVLQGAGGSFVWAINNRGELAGHASEQPFVFSEGRLQPLLPQPEVSYGEATGINDKGQVVGRYNFGEFRGFLWSRKTGFVDTVNGASAINNKGQIIGAARIPESAENIQAFIYEDGQLKPLGTLGGDYSIAQAVNNRGDVVGSSPTTPGDVATYHAFLYRDGVMTDLGTLGGRISLANDINDRRQIVGASESKSGEFRAFLYEDGKMIDIGRRVGGISQAFSINNNGQIVGIVFPVVGQSDSYGFIYAHGRMRDLNKLIDASTGWRLIEARAINDRGQIAAVGCKHGAGCRGLRLDPVKSPAAQ